MKWLVALLVLAGLLIGADRLAEGLAEGAVRDRLEAELGPSSSVEIGGFPFFTQAIGGTYDDVEVAADDVRRGPVRIADLRVRLRGAHLPWRRALTGGVGGIPVDGVTATGLVPYSDLQAVAGHGITLSDEGGAVRVSRTVRVLGRDVPVSALADLTLDGDAIRLTPRTLQVAGPSVPVRLLAGVLDVRVVVPDLPYGLRLSQVAVAPGGVEVRAGAGHVVLRS